MRVAIDSHVLLPVSRGSVSVTACRDPDDNEVLETAVLGGAALVVTGDRDLRVLRSFQGIRIAAPGQWLSESG